MKSYGEREGGRECGCTCIYMYESGREGEGQRLRVCMRAGERERVCVYESGREGESVCV